MAISWVFGREKEFAAITRAAIIGCRANFADEVTDLPIPEKVLGKFPTFYMFRKMLTFE
jgi:hypothetical protein